MGKALVITGVNFSSSKIETVEFIGENVVVTPTFIDTQAVRTDDGAIEANGNQKACTVALGGGYYNVQIRTTGYAPYGLAFYDSENNFISGYGADDFDLHTIEIPGGAKYLRYSYMTDARAEIIGRPIVSSIVFNYEAQS